MNTFNMFIFYILLLSQVSVQAGGVARMTRGRTTRYWDCCKPSCSWPGKAITTRPVLTCSASGVRQYDPNLRSGCLEGGVAFACSNQGPWTVNSTLSYGFAAANLNAKTEKDWCCRCYELTFASSTLRGKKMVVQVTNTGYDLWDNHFDIAIPGGGQGIFQGCTKQYGATGYKEARRYGGVSTIKDCEGLPKALRPGCVWRFTWFKNADNPDVTFKQVTCPVALSDITGCSVKKK